MVTNLDLNDWKEYLKTGKTEMGINKRSFNKRENIKETKPTSYILKTTLMSYYRFKRQYVAVDECMNRDILVDTNKEFHEIEVKISKSDLINGEAKKLIHFNYNSENFLNANITTDNIYTFIPNRYYICVPYYLEETALKWIKETNKKYGLILFNEERFNRTIHKNGFGFGDLIFIRKSAQKIHDHYAIRYKEVILKRLCSSLINKMEKDIRKNLTKEE